uniref:Uncharacterized protein n=1 Tax=Triticum urartu TaxID=4572 RepID=A0A8R7PXH6_TRIUA
MATEQNAIQPDRRRGQIRRACDRVLVHHPPRAALLAVVVEVEDLRWYFFQGISMPLSGMMSCLSSTMTFCPSQHPPPAQVRLFRLPLPSMVCPWAKKKASSSRPCLFKSSHGGALNGSSSMMMPSSGSSRPRSRRSR